MKYIKILLFAFMIICPAVSAQIKSAQSGDWSSASTWTGGIVPSDSDNVVIVSSHTVNIDNANAMCDTISFEAIDAKISMGSSTGILSVYGDFIPYSTAHIVFSNWTDGAVLKFAGSKETQTIKNIRNNNTETNMVFFKSIVVDKSAGKLTLAGSSDSKLNLSNSLEIVNGTFEVPEAFDINGREFNGSADAAPVILVKSGGTFTMNGGASQIMSRPGLGKIGKMTIYGNAALITTSTNKINLDNVDIEKGGTLKLLSGWSSSNLNLFKAGTITVKDGGILYISITTDIWDASTAVVVEKGGIFKTSASTTVLPVTFTNNGTFWYARSSTGENNQTIIDMNYSGLRISYTNSGTKKTWALTTDRTISDSLIIDNNGILEVTAASAQKLTLNGSMELVSGSFDNDDSNITFQMGDNLNISRTTGSIVKTPDYLGIINLNYKSADSLITTGNEAPSSSGALKNVTVSGSAGIVLGSNLDVNGTIDLSGGSIATGSFQVNLNAGAELKEYSGKIIVGTVYAQRTLSTGTNNTFGGIGFELNASGASPGITAVTRVNNSGASVYGILRHFTVVPAVNSGLNATVKFYYDESELNGKTESTLQLYKSAVSSSNWNNMQGSLDALNNVISLTGADSMGEWTLNGSTATGVQTETSIPTAFKLMQNYPNPFNPSTNIVFSIPEAANVRIKIYDILGKEIALLMDEYKSAGKYNCNFNSARYNLPSGMYLYSVEAGRYNSTKKMILVK